MTEKLFGPERKPWEPNADARLAPSSYGATALFGIAEMAVEELHRQGVDMTPQGVGQYARLFGRVIVKVQVELSESGGWAAAMNTRLRGALHTALRVVDFDPTDQDDLVASLEDWEERLREVVLAIAKTAAWMHTLTPAGLGIEIPA